MTLTLIPTLNQTLTSNKRYEGPRLERNQLTKSVRRTKIFGSGILALTPRFVTGFENLPTIAKSTKLNSAREHTGLMNPWTTQYECYGQYH